MSKGLFFDNRPSDIRGLFYYSEPESTTFLSYRRSFTAFNKTDAAMKLLEEREDKNLSSVLKIILEENALKKERIFRHIKGELPEGLRFFWSEAEKLVAFGGGIQNFKSEKKVYLGASALNLYAYEDPLDQPLCKLASKLGYDIVILTHMVGSNQVVTEVMDTRPDSIKHLWFLRD